MAVTDFGSKRFWRSLEHRLELVDTSLPFASVRRYTGGAANESSVDRVDLGVARERVLQLFTKYGFAEEPQTWAELRGNHRYIEDLQTALDTVRVGYGDNVDAGLSFIQSFRPALVDAVRVCINEGFEGLQKYHREQETYRRNTAAYDEGTELADKSYDDADNEWPEHLR